MNGDVTSADVVIIGGGVMGASAAFWLTRMSPGLRVLVAEPDPSYARAATALSVASIRQQFTNPVNVAMSRFGIGFIRDIAGQVGPQGGVSTLGFRENGYLFLAGGDAAAATMTEVAAMQRGLGASTELLDKADIAARFPWLALDDVVLGSFGPRDEGWFDNMGLLSAFRSAARHQGARFITDRVIGLETAPGAGSAGRGAGRRAGAWSTEDTDHRSLPGEVGAGCRVTAVRLAGGGTIGAGTVICAAGTQAASILAMIGASLPVEPRKRTVFVIDAPNARHPDAPLLVDHTGFYLRPEGAHWITAIVPERDGPADPTDFTPELDEFEGRIWPLLYARAPGFDAVKVVRAWAGHYDFNTLDQNAILGPWPTCPNLFLMSGFSGHGLQQAPAAGRGIAEMIVTGHCQTIDLAPLGAARVLGRTPMPERAIV